jgi:hypothetical protein
VPEQFCNLVAFLPILRSSSLLTAAIDRLVHHCVVLELNISSYWMEKAKKVKTKK